MIGLLCFGLAILISPFGSKSRLEAENAVLVGNPIRLVSVFESGGALPMRDVCRLIWLALVGLFQSRVSLEVEILALRHQLNVLGRKSPK